MSACSATSTAAARCEWTYAELTRFGESQKYAGGTCADGAHRIQSEGPFSLTVWGMSQAASYAYPGARGSVASPR
jgi:hypothetical protein